MSDFIKLLFITTMVTGVAYGSLEGYKALEASVDSIMVQTYDPSRFSGSDDVFSQTMHDSLTEVNNNYKEYQALRTR